MLKLYKKTKNEFKYWETWDISDDMATIHWGDVGTQGETINVKSTLASDNDEFLKQEIDKLIDEGYQPIDNDEHFVLLIEFAIDGMGTELDVEKRHNLENRMNETLGWTALGHCDGGSIGSGTMEVCCFVVDFDIAKKVIEEDLIATEFSDYTRIYDENE